MKDLTGTSFGSNQIVTSLIISSVILILTFMYVYLKKQVTQVHIIKELFYLGLLYLVFKTSTLILSFAIYFILWHSIPSVLDQVEHLSSGVSKKSLFQYFKSAGLIWILSISGLVVIYYSVDESLLSSAIFLLLYAVTAPHTWVMYRMKKTSE